MGFTDKMVKCTTIFLLFTISLAASGADNNYDAVDRLTAVWQGSDYVLATTSNGLFRASLADKKWARLNPPPEMGITGTFGRVPTNANFVLFIATTDITNKSGGIYISRDQGTSWHLISKEFKFRTAYAHEDGTIYASAMKAGTWSPSANQVLMSTNMGKTWCDLFAGIQGLDIYKIFSDPDHTNLVCLYGSGIRGYILQAADERYEWKWIAAFNWKRYEPNDERFFRRVYSTQSVLYNYCATLKNYFNYDFDGEVQISAFCLIPLQTPYHFRLKGPKPIRPKIAFLPSDTKVKLVDCSYGNDLWELRIKTPDGQYLTGKRGLEPDKLRERKDFRVIEVAAESPYERTIDLDGMFEFTKPGKYLLQLIYYSSRTANRDLGEWPGSFSSKPFEAVID